MKRCWILLALLLPGCSTAPVADFLDSFFPGQLPPGKQLQPASGVCQPQGGLAGSPAVPVVPPPVIPGPGVPVGPPPGVPGPGSSIPPPPPNGNLIIPPPIKNNSGPPPGSSGTRAPGGKPGPVTFPQ